MGTTKCGGCGRKLDESASLPPSERLPCPSCGSTARAFSEQVEDKVTNRERLGFKVKCGGKRRPAVEGVSGADLHRKSGRWMHLTRLIDRKKDRYEEVVTDPETGEVIHECRERLSDHRGHGAARRREENPSEQE